MFGTKSLPVYKYSSKIVAVPFELLQDASVDVEAFVQGRMVTRLGRITNTHFTVGTGTAQPNGVITAAGTGVTAANSTSQVSAIIYDSVINLIHSVDPAYRALGNCKFMMNDASVRRRIMASVVGDIAIQVGADISPLVRDLGKGSKAVSKFGNDAKSSTDGIAFASNRLLKKC